VIGRFLCYIVNKVYTAWSHMACDFP